MFYLKMFLKAFLYSTLGVGLFWWLRLRDAASPVDAVCYAIILGSISGFIASLGVVLLDYLRRRAVFKKYGCKSFDLIQSRQVYLDGSISNAINKCIEALKNVKGVIKITTNNEENEITAIRGFNWKTPGEKLRIKLHEQAGKVLVSIHSRPRIKGAIADGGRSIENVEEILRNLRSEGNAT